MFKNEINSAKMLYLNKISYFCKDNITVLWLKGVSPIRPQHLLTYKKQRIDIIKNGIYSRTNR